MAMEQVLHMVGGAGETSYASNSKIQVIKLISLLNIYLFFYLFILQENEKKKKQCFNFFYI